MKTKIFVLGMLMAGFSFAEFNKFEGVGARSLGMGGAFTAISNDASCLYYNPAGLLRIEDREEMYMYSQKLNELTYQYVGLVWKNTGFSYLNQGGNLAKADNQWGDKVGESVYGMSYAKKVNGGVGLGASLKILHYTNERDSDSGFGFDMGLLYSPEIKEDLSLGLAIRNLGAKIQGEKVDPTITGGVAIRLSPVLFWKGLRNDGFGSAYSSGFRRKSFFEEEPFPLLVSLDLYNKKDNKDKNKLGWALGGEYKAFDILLFRLGFNNGNIGGGVGLAHDKWRLDYAYSTKDLIERVDNHYLSLSMSF
ncbi:MAG: hypothetical protein AB1630_00565 [bacterium]